MQPARNEAGVSLGFVFGEKDRFVILCSVEDTHDLHPLPNLIINHIVAMRHPAQARSLMAIRSEKRVG